MKYCEEGWYNPSQIQEGWGMSSGALRKKIRVAIGAASSLLLLIMIFLQFINPALMITDRILNILLALIGATILFDTVRSSLPLELTITEKQDGSGNSNDNNNNN